MRGVQIPVILLFVDDHNEHLGHSVVHPLNASVAVRMVGACCELAHPNSWYTACESLEQDYWPLSESMVRGHPRKGNLLVNQDIGRTLSGKLSGSGSDISARRRKRSVISKI